MNSMELSTTTRRMILNMLLGCLNWSYLCDVCRLPCNWLCLVCAFWPPYPSSEVKRRAYEGSMFECDLES